MTSISPNDLPNPDAAQDKALLKQRKKSFKAAKERWVQRIAYKGISCTYSRLFVLSFQNRFGLINGDRILAAVNSPESTMHIS